MLKKKIISRMLVLSLSSMILCGIFTFASNAYGQSHYDPTPITLGNGTTGTYSTGNSEKNASFKGTSTSTSSTRYTVKLSVSGSTTTERTLISNGTQTVYWSGLLRDRTFTWRLYNGGGNTIVKNRDYSTYY